MISRVLLNALKVTPVVVLFILGSLPNTAFAQSDIRGTITNTALEPLENAHVKLVENSTITRTDKDGIFTFSGLQSGSYTLVVTYLGAKTHRLEVHVDDTDLELTLVLQEDILNLDNIVLTGSTAAQRQLESGITMTTLGTDQLRKTLYNGTADLLQSIPGIITDPAAGEVFTRVYSRGISASAQDDLGWYYVGLQEDGLPVSLVQHSYYSPDLFHRTDVMTEKVEVLRGGNAVISATNAPGGVYNFISRGARSSLGGELQVNGGLQGENNAQYRIDGVLSGPIAKDWFFAVGGHYRRDEGARNTDFTFSKGGQVKFNLSKVMAGGTLQIHVKYLNDYTNRYTGVAATNWEDPTAAFGQDFKYSSLLMPGFDGMIPDGRNVDQSNGFNPANGVHAKDFAVGVNFDHDLGNDWNVLIDGKYSTKVADWQTSISNAFVSIHNPLAYFISGADFPIGQVVFRDARTTTEIARVDNSGILAGQDAAYLTAGRLPNDAIMGTSAWYKYTTAKEWMNQLTLKKKWVGNELSFGIASGFSNADVFTQGSFAFTTYSPNSTLLRVTLENPNEPVLDLSDENGLSNYGGLFYVNAEAKVSQNALFITDRYEINGDLSADLGLRYEQIIQKGSKDRFAPLERDGGVDGDARTAYDKSLLMSTGQKDKFNYTYEYLSLSAGLNYMLADNLAVFGRYSLGHKAPELDYYFNNFSNVPINKKGEIQHIQQIELGAKLNGDRFSTTATLFMSRLTNIGTSNFEFDQDNGSIFYTPIQSNSSRSVGLEWETAYSPITNLTVRFNGTLQDARTIDWTLYKANGTVDTADDSMVDFSDQTLPFTPSFIGNLKAEYVLNKLGGFVSWRYTGEREGNIANAFKLPSYSEFNAGLSYVFTSQWSASVLVTNLFNSAGLSNFFGPNSFGANADDVSAEFIANNRNASFIVVPILPRRAVLRLSYRF